MSLGCGLWEKICNSRLSVNLKMGQQKPMTSYFVSGIQKVMPSYVEEKIT